MNIELSPRRARMWRLKIIENTFHCPITECWIWQAYVNHKGYGRVKIDSSGRGVMVHCLSYILFIGPYPDELELDHNCHNRACANPWHCEPVTHSENLKRRRSWTRRMSRGHR